MLQPANAMRDASASRNAGALLDAFHAGTWEL